MTPDYRRVLRRLLITVYGGIGLYAVLIMQSLAIVGIVVLAAALTYSAVQVADTITERDWALLLPRRKDALALPPPDEGSD